MKLDNIASRSESSAIVAKMIDVSKKILRFELWYTCSQIEYIPWLVILLEQQIITPIRVPIVMVWAKRYGGVAAMPVINY